MPEKSGLGKMHCLAQGFHIVSPPRKLGALVPRGIGGFVELNSLDFFTIEVLSVNLSLLIMI
jgi:hypothetical protein